MKQRKEPIDPVVREFYRHHKKDKPEALREHLRYYRELSRVVETGQVIAAIAALHRLIAESRHSG